jgi:adenosylcobinamide-phosphate synthase
MVFGEFKFLTHPVVLMGRYICIFEDKLYQNSIKRGFILWLSLISIVYLAGYFLETILFQLGNFGVFILGVIASTTVANRMLFDSVREIIVSPQKIEFLVSRDTESLSQSEINRASIETYSENLSDGVVAPLFYLLLFGVTGAFIYKAINTLDSMVGYRTGRYERFGKFSAKMDDIANYIPSRITALLIATLSGKLRSFSFYRYAKAHSSPNAGYPMSAMALALNLKLGGRSSYFGQVVDKPHFGDGREKIFKRDIKRALRFYSRINTLLVTFLTSLLLLNLD